MINKLITRIKETNAPIVVGLDPMMKFVPEYIKKAAFAEYGETLEGAAEAIWQFNKAIIDATYDLIPAVKPQIAIVVLTLAGLIWGGIQVARGQVDDPSGYVINIFWGGVNIAAMLPLIN